MEDSKGKLAVIIPQENITYSICRGIDFCRHRYFYRLTKIFKPLNTTDMLRFAAIFFTIVIIAAIFGFGGIAVGAASIAKVLFYIFLILFLVTLIFGGSLFNRRD